MAAPYEREFDRPLTPRERAGLRKAVKIASGGAAKKKRSREADAAYQQVLSRTGDRARAEKVRAAVMRQRPQVSRLTEKAAKSGRLPSPALADTAVRSRLQAAGIVPKIPGGGLVGKAGRNIVEDLFYTPAGVYEAGKAVVGDVADTAQGRPTAKRTARVAKAVAESTVETVRHPLRRPGDTALLGFGALSAGAGLLSRAGAAAAAAKEASAAGRSATRAALTRAPREGGALLRRPVPAARTRKLGGLEVKSRSSMNPAVRVAQRAYDLALEHPQAEGRKISRVGREIAAQRRVDAAVGRAPAVALARSGKRLTSAQQIALRVVHEGVPVETVIAKHRQLLAEAKTPRAKRNLARRIGLLEEARARGFVVTRDGAPELGTTFKTPRKANGRRGANPAELAQASRLIEEVATGREKVLADALDLPDTYFERRRHAPGALLSDNPEFTGGRTRIPDTGRRTRQPSQPSPYRGGVPRKPGSLTNQYTGAARRSGSYPVSTTKAVAETAVEGARYADVDRLRKQVVKAGVRERPATGEFVPVRVRKLTREESRGLQAMLARLDMEPEALTASEAQRVAQAWQAHLNDVFPNPAEFAHVRAGETVGGVVWVPRKLLDGINRQYAAGFVSKGLGALDTVQNVHKAGIILAKPAYVVANAVSNALFNLVHQGVLAPVNWQRAARLSDDARLAALVDEAMGSGASRALGATNPRGSLAGATSAVADRLNRLTDLVFRRAAFLHEARRMGHRTDDELRALLTDPKKRDELHEITGRAVSEIVDYDRMGPFERDVVRRVLFIYPWVKGATMYAGHFLTEHPVQAAVYSQLANVGREQAREDLGQVPSWARGTFKVGGTDEFPLTVNPAALSPLSQGAEIAQATMGALSGNEGDSDRLFELLTPLIQQAVESAQGRDSFTGAPLEGSPLETFATGLVQQTAPGVLAHNLTDPSRTYPMTAAESLERFALGSFAPRTTSREALNESAGRENVGDYTPAERARRSVFQERQTIYETMKANDPELLDQSGRLPAPVRQAYNRAAEIEAARATARDNSDGDSRAYYAAAAVAEARLYEKWGAAPPGFAAGVARLVKTAPLDVLKSGTRRMRDDLAPDAYRDIVSEGGKYLERRGVS